MVSYLLQSSTLSLGGDDGNINCQHCPSAMTATADHSHVVDDDDPKEISSMIISLTDSVGHQLPWELQ